MVEHCPRSLVEVCSSEAAGVKHALLLTLLENHDGRTVEMVRETYTHPDMAEIIIILVPRSLINCQTFTTDPSL